MSAPRGEGPGAPAPPPHLEIRALAVRYGAIRAVHDVSLEVRHDEIVTLQGTPAELSRDEAIVRTYLGG